MASVTLERLVWLRHWRRHGVSSVAAVNIHVRDLSQLFNSFDPSPFWDRDLDREAAIVSRQAGRPGERVMAQIDQPRPEIERIELLLERDGIASTRTWVERTLAIYRRALADPRHYANDPSYEPRFEKSVREFEEWLAGHKP